MLRKHEKYIAYILLILDYIGVVLTYLISAPAAPILAQFVLGEQMQIFSCGKIAGELYEYYHRYHNFFLPLLLFPFFSYKLSNMHSIRKFSSIRDAFRETDVLLGATLILLTMYVVLTPFSTETIIFISLQISLLWFFFIAIRVLLVYYLKLKPDNVNTMNHILIVGTDPVSLQIAKVLTSYKELTVKIVGFLTSKTEEIGKKIDGVEVIGLLHSLSDVLKKNVVDCVIVSEGVKDRGLIQQITHLCDIAGIDALILSSLISGTSQYPYIERFDSLYFVNYRALEHSTFKIFIKRVFDLIASAALIIILIPIWLLVPVIIKLDSKGPAYFVQERIGKNGRRFRMYKFRSMTADADSMRESLMEFNEMDGAAFKMKEDPRITRFGKIIRKTSIDELPQVFNVFKGDMSLVGPRPLPDDVTDHGLQNKKRLSVKPGITCLWQISGRNQIKFDEWMRLDIYYIDNWSLTLDIKILFKTFFVVLAGKGAQ
ncbi:MAG: sugar transferase [Desulfobacterales bacterium]|nr:sugar transferase [Desulfobacterales bacterium]